MTITNTRTIKPSRGAYTSLINWEAGRQADLVTGDLIEIAECYSMQDTTAVVINGWTTGAINYIKIYTPTAERHNGTYQTSKYYLNVSEAIAIAVQEDYVRVDGLQCQVTTTSVLKHGIMISGQTNVNNLIWISNNIFKGVISGGNGTDCHGIYVYESNSAGSVVKVWNCIAYNWFNSTYPDNTSNHGFNNTYGLTTFYNCTAYKCGMGFVKGSTYSTTAINCLSINNAVRAAYIDFSGTITQSYNISSDTTSDGTGSIDSQGLTDVDFVNTTAGSEDFHLQSTSTAIGVGTDNPGSGLYSDDIDGVARTSTWDIGADEYVAAGGLKIPVAMANYRQRSN